MTTQEFINHKPTSGCVEWQTCENPEELFSQWTNGWMPLIEVSAPSLPGWMYVLFDTEELFSDDTSRTIQLKSKVFPNKLDFVRTDANGQIVWREKINGFTKSTIKNNVTGANKVIVDSLSDLQGIWANTNVMINTTTIGWDTVAVLAVVTEVNSSTGELTLDRNVTVKKGDRLYRGSNNRDLCEDIANTYTPTCEVPYYSNFQSLQLSMNFTADDLAKDRVIYAYGENENTYIDRLWKPAKQGFNRELAYTILFGENTSSGVNTKTTTRGIFPSLIDAETCTGNSYIYDFTSCIGEDDDDAVISAYLDVLKAARESGYYEDGVMTAMINNAQWFELIKMRSSFYNYAGIQVIEENRTTHSGMYDYINLKVISISTDFGKVEFVMDSSLSEYFPSTPIMVIFPKKMIAMYQRKYDKVDSNMKAIANSWVPTLKMEDITPYVSYKNGGDECFSFVGKMWFAIALWGIYNGAWRVIKNMKSYKSGLACDINSLTGTIVASN